MRRVLCILACLAIAGCGSESGQWAKPGASSAEQARDTEQCRNEAAAKAPPDFVTLSSDPTQGSRPLIASRPAPGANLPAQDVSPTSVTDRNAQARETLFRDCMASRGYQRGGSR